MAVAVEEHGGRRSIALTALGRAGRAFSTCGTARYLILVRIFTTLQDRRKKHLLDRAYCSSSSFFSFICLRNLKLPLFAIFDISSVVFVSSAPRLHASFFRPFFFCPLSNLQVGTGREQEAYLSHILRHYHSLEGNRDHSNNPRLTRRLHLQQEHQASKEQEAEKQRQQQQKQRFAQVEHKQQEQQLEQKQQQQEQRRQLGRSKGWRLGQSALNSHSSPTSGGGSHGHLHGLGRTYLVFLQADAPLEFQLPPFAGDPAAALEAMAAADDDGNDDDDGGNGKGDRRNDGSSSDSSSASSSSSSSESRRGSSARSSSSRSNRRDASSSSSSAGVLGYASLTGTAFRTPPPQGFRKRVAATWLNPVDNRAPRARYLCRWSPVQLAMQAASGMHSGASSLTPPFFSTAANASANAISSLSAPSPSFTSSPAAPQSLPPLSRWASEDKEVDCRRAYLTPSRAQFVASPSRVKALPYETWEALHALSVTSTGVSSSCFACFANGSVFRATFCW